MPGVVIVGFDGSPNAERAIDFAATRLGAESARVVTVWERGLAAAHPATALVGAGPPAAPEDRQLEAAAREIAEAGAARARAAGLPAEPEIRPGIGVGEIADALFDAAEEHGADMVVLGHRGMGAFKAAVLGSVSDAAVHRGRVAVLVVPGGHERGSASR